MEVNAEATEALIISRICSGVISNAEDGEEAESLASGGT